MNSKRKRLIEGIKSILQKQTPGQDHFCLYKDEFYRFDDIDHQTWKPKKDAHGMSKGNVYHSDIFKLGDLKIFF